MEEVTLITMTLCILILPYHNVAYEVLNNMFTGRADGTYISSHSIGEVLVRSKIWSVYSGYPEGDNVFFKDSGGDIYFYSDESPYQTIFTVFDLLLDASGVSLNPWGNLPDNVEGLVALDTDYLVITNDQRSYILKLNYAVVINKPEVTLIDNGHVTFV